MPDRILVVTASRDCTDRELFRILLGGVHREYPEAALYVGDARGGDTIAVGTWADLHDASVRELEDAGLLARFAADWDGPCRGARCTPGHRKPRGDGTTWCPFAGVHRNLTMCSAAARTGMPVTTLAVEKEGAGNRGTRACMIAMRRHGLPAPIRATEKKTTGREPA